MFKSKGLHHESTLFVRAGVQINDEETILSSI